MFKAQSAICSVTGCESNANRWPRAVCSACGKCGNDSFHEGCSASSGMRAPILDVCGGGDDCLNAVNGLQVLVCLQCGRCGNCTEHGHA